MQHHSDNKMVIHSDQIDYAGQQTLVATLLDVHLCPKELQEVRLIETHVSWVLLAGKYAYKIKKALNLGFLDFTSLQARLFYCLEEIRLNHRLAPDIYLDVIPIGGKPEAPETGQLPAIEYAVRMNCFIPENQLDQLLARGQVSMRLIDDLAASLADFHLNLPLLNNDAPYGSPASIREVVRENFNQLRSLPTEEPNDDFLENIVKTTEIVFAEREKYFDQRHRQGFIRECHGDLHLGNIVLIGKRLVPFDGIEFNPALRWIDVMDDVAFLVMDLLNAHRPDAAFRFLNAYLEETGDYAGLSLLAFYIAYRAEVRAKIYALLAAQSNLRVDIYMQHLEKSRRYLALAAQSLSKQHPSIIITHGLPGSGKSTLAQSVVERYQVIRIRSDVERKRIFGLKPLDNSDLINNHDIYSAETTQRTYNHLLDLAQNILSAGYSMIVVAAFLQHKERELFQKLALGMAAPFIIVSVKATLPTLKSRIMLRRNQADDPSEADIAVLEMLQSAQELLLPLELEKTVECLNENDSGIAEDNPIWNALETLMESRQ
jgi:aminoglycoside phosphotransferase family enzyme/predicted kinase